MSNRPNREGALRVDQRLNESPDIFAMRAFLKALPYMERQAAYAAAKWIYEIAVDPKTWQRADIEFGERAESAEAELKVV